MDKDIVIVAASRAAAGTFGGAISRIQASSLGVKVMQVLLVFFMQWSKDKWNCHHQCKTHDIQTPLKRV